jgi:hypothetical protein
MPPKIDASRAENLMLMKGFQPLVPYPGSHKPWKSQCLKCKQEVTPTFSSIKSGTGCGVCSQRIIPEAWADCQEQIVSPPCIIGP